MRNQTSFRLTTTLLPSDTTAKTTTVINKVDSNGDKFYPTFTEETVVITNDDRTVMETTRAICTDWALTFVKRGLSDDASETPVDNRKLTWNPWSLCFITAWAWDWIDKDDNITWTGNQTYTGNLVSQWNATYNWLLTTNKWVKYPHFDSLEDLQDYASPFGWMFAVVDSDWELYRYNDVSDTWSVVTTSTPAQPAQASTVAIWTVRGATDAEFAAWTATGSNSELLVATPAQIKGATEFSVLPLIDTTDTAWASAILAAFLDWKKPVIEYYGDDAQQRVKDYYFLSQAIPNYLYFYWIGLGKWTDWTWTYIKWDYITIEYSGTTFSSVSHTVKKAYVNSVA